jgi:hypothetical protein
MSNRASRRAEIARFCKELSDGLRSYLVARDDPRLAREPLLRNAISFWCRNVPTRRPPPQCFACAAQFAHSAQAGAYLMVTALHSPSSCSVSGLCTACWRNLSDDEIKAAADRACREIAPGGL